MKKDEKILWLVVAGMGGVLAWLYLHKNPAAIQYINKVAGDLGLPQLTIPAIPQDSGTNYAIPVASFPNTPNIDMGTGCCPTCETKGMSLPPSSPVPIAQPTIEEVQHVIYQTQYVAPPAPVASPQVWKAS